MAERRCVKSMYIHINLLCCCLERCCLLLLHPLWSNSIQGNQLTSLTAFWHNFVSKNICVRFCDGVPQSLRPSALLCVWHMCIALPVRQERWKGSKFLLWCQVVSCYCVGVKQGQYNQQRSEKQKGGRLSSRVCISGFPLILEFQEFWEQWSKQAIWRFLLGYPGGSMN